MLRPETNLTPPFHLESKRDYDTSVLTFLRLFFREWSLAMVGPLSIPFLIISAFFSGTAGVTVLILSTLCLYVGVWAVWKKERIAKHVKASALLNEQNKNSRPDIGIEIQEVYAEHIVRKDGISPNHLDEYFTIKAHLVNKGRPIAIRQFKLYINFENSVKQASATPLSYLAFEYKRTVVSKVTFLVSESETVQEPLTELSREHIEHGDNREGWLRFVLPEISGKQIDEIKGVTLWIVDAESNVHQTTANNEQWRQTGRLVNLEQQRFQQELERIEAEQKAKNKRIVDGIEELIERYRWAEKQPNPEHWLGQCGGRAYEFLQRLGGEYTERFKNREPENDVEILKEIQREFTC